jgi:SAM-dependent methyltransferase
MTKVVQHPDSHVSNALCGRAVELIERAVGPVLNLSAGGSSRWYPHVVEAEASIFRNTDLVADAHALPFQDECFELVLAMNAFEHYANPAAVAAEIYRVLRPGGRIFLHTAFLQPLHEPPFHFYNCTKYGLARWFQEFRTLELSVSENFSPGFTTSWLLSEVETLLRESASPQLAEAFSQSRIADNIQYWRDPSARRGAIWRALAALPQEAQERVAAGFQFLGQKE